MTKVVVAEVDVSKPVEVPVANFRTILREKQVKDVATSGAVTIN